MIAHVTATVDQRLAQQFVLSHGGLPFKQMIARVIQCLFGRDPGLFNAPAVCLANSSRQGSQFIR